MTLQYPIIPGTTLVLLATNGLTRYKSATGAVVDGATGLLRITSAQFSALQSLFFTAGGVHILFLSIHEPILINFNFFCFLTYRPPLS